MFREMHMRVLKTLGVFVALAAVALAAAVWAPSVYGQRDDDFVRQARHLAVLAGGGSTLGVTVHDPRPAEAGGGPAGVVIDDVQAGSPAEKAGLKRGDVLVEFDGERVRSVRQFARLVQETAPGRTVKATMMRDGRRSEIEMTPREDQHGGHTLIHPDFGNYMRDFGRLGDSFNFDFDVDVMGGGRRLGVTVEPLTSQLADYFAAKEGLLITSVADASAASRAGLKAGDVITSLAGHPVRTRQDLLTALRDAREDEVSIGIVREKKEMTVKVRVESSRRTTGRQPV